MKLSTLNTVLVQSILYNSQDMSDVFDKSRQYSIYGISCERDCTHNTAGNDGIYIIDSLNASPHFSPFLTDTNEKHCQGLPIYYFS